MFGHLSLAIVLMAFVTVLTWAVDRLQARRIQSTKSVTPPSHPCTTAHDLVPIDAQPLTGDAFPFPQTICLKRCQRCGYHVAIGYAGKWTIEDFVKTRNDIAELERMAK